jgi:hypothetical protein
VARLPDWADCRRAAARRLCEWQVVRAMAARSGDVGAVAPSTRGDTLAQVENLHLPGVLLLPIEVALASRLC